jgi:hypothetical protein
VYEHVYIGGGGIAWPLTGELKEDGMIVRVAKAGVVLLILGAGAVAAFMAAGVSAST